MSKRRILIAISFFLAAASAQAVDKDTLIEALGKIVGYSEKCGYNIDQDALLKLYSEKGLDDPESFNSLTTNTSFYRMAANATDTDCAFAKITGKKLGIIH